MRVSRVWLVYAVTGGIAVVGAAVSATEVSLRCAAVAFGALAWHVAVGARSTAARLRWPLAAGCVVFAAAALARLYAATDPPQDVGWVAYGPPGTAELTAMRDAVARGLGWELRMAGVQLGAVVLLAGAVTGLPSGRGENRRRPRLVATAVVALLVVAWILADRWLGIDTDLLGAAVREIWPALLAAAAGLALLVLAGRHADHRWLVAAGAALVAVQAATTLSDATGTWLTVSALTDWLCSDDGHMMAVSTAVDEGGSLQSGPALATLVTLAGPALVVAGALRAGTPEQG